MSLPSLTLGELADRLQLTCHGDRNRVIEGLATLAQARPTQLSFLANPRYRRYLIETSAGAVIVAPALVDESPVDCLVADDPYLAYARVSQLFDRSPRPAVGIAATAVVAPSARLAAEVSVGPGAVIGDDVEIGTGAIIGANCVIEARSSIADHCRLYPNVTVGHGTYIGSHTIIHSGAVLGSDGFGFAPGPAGWEKIAQLGSVRVGRKVEIGANTTIDRGALDDTVIGDGVIIDNQVQIAHNVRIGESTAIAGCVGIAGSVTIGAHCTIAGGAGLSGHITIADGIHIGAMTLVTRSLTERGSYSSGTGTMATPAWRKSAVRFSQLDELYRRVAELEKRLQATGEGARSHDGSQ